MPPRDRARFLAPIILDSTEIASRKGFSLALLRPKNTRFYVRPKSVGEIEEEKEEYRIAASQLSMFDKSLSEIEPTPYDFFFKFEDGYGKHEYKCGDWEAHAMFWRECHRTSSQQALDWMSSTFRAISRWAESPIDSEIAIDKGIRAVHWRKPNQNRSRSCTHKMIPNFLKV